MRISDWSSDVCSSDLPASWLACFGCAWAILGFGSHPWRVGLIQALALMRYIIAIITGVAVVLAGCQPSRDDVLADAAQRQAEVLRQRSEEHTSELQSLMRISYAVFCLKKKKKTQK